MPVADRKKLVDKNLANPGITRQCGLLGLARSTYYHKPTPAGEQDLQIMHTMDRMYQEDPTRGTRRYADDLAHEGYKVGRDKVRRLMQLMAIAAVYCKPRTTVIDPARYKYPYLLRGLAINRANQVWQIDISYVPLRRVFFCIWWGLSMSIVGISWVGTSPTPWMPNGWWVASSKPFVIMGLLKSSIPIREASLPAMSISHTSKV